MLNAIEYKELKNLLERSQVIFNLCVEQQQDTKLQEAQELLHTMLIENLEKIASRDRGFKCAFTALYFDWYEQALAPYKPKFEAV